MATVNAMPFHREESANIPQPHLGQPVRQTLPNSRIRSLFGAQRLYRIDSNSADHRRQGCEGRGSDKGEGGNGEGADPGGFDFIEQRSNIARGDDAERETGDCAEEQH